MELPSRLSKELGGVIQADEEVVDAVYGLRNQVAILTDRRVVVSKRGINAGAIFGSKTTSYPFEMIVGVEVQTSGVRTVLTVRSASDQAGQGFLVLQTLDKNVWNAPNTVPFNRGDRDRVQQFAEQVNRLKKQNLDGKRQSAGSSQSSVADELAKLAKLKADGVLSEEEFAAQKARLMS
jgi:hypothetical protein